jgi:hypothetical protein
MGSFFSALVGSYAQGTMQKKQVEQAREDAAKKAEINALGLAMDNPNFNPDMLEPVTDRIIELSGTKGGAKGKGGGNALKSVLTKLRGQIPKDQQYQPQSLSQTVSAGVNQPTSAAGMSGMTSARPEGTKPGMAAPGSQPTRPQVFLTADQQRQRLLKDYQAKSDIDTSKNIRVEQARIQAAKPVKVGSTTQAPGKPNDGTVYNIWENPETHEREYIEDVQQTDKAKLNDAQVKSQNALVNLRKAQADFEKARNDPNSPEFKLAFDRLQVAKQNVQLRQRGQDLQAASYELRRDIADRPVAATRARADQAKIITQKADDTEDQIDALRDQMGPLVGRENLLDVKVGDVNPAVRGLKTNLDSIASMLALLHGYRGSAQIQQLFHETVGDLATNPDAVIDSIEQIKKTAQIVIDVASQGQGLTAPKLDGGASKPTTRSGSRPTVPPASAPNSDPLGILQ